MLGIIGRNGAGKSTLLKILSRITDPTLGRVRMRGRVSSLLEVGTGFHPELSGRDNVYLNATILGMRKVEIDRRFDEIVDFSGIEQFIDTPIKRYSSGMKVRLAFAVAAHLDPEILIIDEVLAVGDTEFQKKCLGKMQDVTTSGRTVLFVSHNMAAVQSLCHTCLWLEQGTTHMAGPTSEVISSYLQTAAMTNARSTFADDPQKSLCIRKIEVSGNRPESNGLVDWTEPVTLTVEYSVRERISGAHVIALVSNIEGVQVMASSDCDANPEQSSLRQPGRYCATMRIPARTLGPGLYYAGVSVVIPKKQRLDIRNNAVQFEIVDQHGGLFNYHQNRILAMRLPWSTESMD